MVRLLKGQILLIILAGMVESNRHIIGMPRISREEAYEQLKLYTGKDFGYELEKWTVYLKEMEAEFEPEWYDDFLKSLKNPLGWLNDQNSNEPSP